ncbi:hypothetical protein [Clostridium sp. HBUAS56010]|uniref:hypothetical protein n=1 Tax=Clostridium sp. HBUAS56010 TaxID=2571127 RepID=UPI001178B657|nr:hypothetical protein [Clostridium sp. HBUAS56010]
MKYFEIQDSPELKYAPQLKNWYGTFDVRDIRIDTFPKLPERQLFNIEPCENTIFTDIILFPFLLVSPMVKEVIEMYREHCFFRIVILLDQLNKESRLYYLPVLDESNDIQLQKVQYKDGESISATLDAEREKVELDRNLFWVKGLKKRHTILSLNMAESLIRRGVTGLGLCEVELYSKK